MALVSNSVFTVFTSVHWEVELWSKEEIPQVFTFTEHSCYMIFTKHISEFPGFVFWSKKNSIQCRGLDRGLCPVCKVRSGLSTFFLPHDIMCELWAQHPVIPLTGPVSIRFSCVLQVSSLFVRQLGEINDVGTQPVTTNNTHFSVFYQKGVGGQPEEVAVDNKQECI